MPQARKHQISLDATPYYHCVSRCVRRAFLCGTDKLTGRCFEHRRQWLEDRILLFASIFAIDVCAYAVMSNHIDIIIKLCPEQMETLSGDQIVQRWSSRFKGPLPNYSACLGYPER